MKTFSRVAIGLGLLLGSGFCAMADIARLQNDVELTNEGTGSFATNKAVNTIESFSIDVTAPEKQGDFTDTETVATYLPTTFGIANPGVSKYTEPYSFSDPINGISNNVLLGNADQITSVTNLVATPEPSGLPFLGAAAILMGLLIRRKLLRVS